MDLNHRNRLVAAIVSAVVFALAVFITILAYFFVGNSLRQYSEVKFRAAADAYVNAVNEKLNRDTRMLYGFRGLYAASHSVERNEFQAFSDQLNIAANFPSLSAVSYWEVVKKENAAAFTADFKKDTSTNSLGYPDFKIYPATGNDNYLVVKYIYPEQPNRSVLGFDIWTSPERSSSAILALEANLPMATGNNTSLSDQQRIFIITLPIFENGQPTKTFAERKKALVGFVNAAINVDKFFSDSSAQSGVDLSDISINVIDDNNGNLNDTNDQTILFQTKAKTGKNQQQEYSKNLSVLGRAWNMQFSGPSNYGLSFLENYLTWLIVIFGLIVAILSALMVYVLLMSRIRALDLANKITKNLRESEAKFNAITQTAKDAIVIMDDKALVVLWSHGAELMFGYTEKEMMGKEFHRIIAVNKVHQNKKDNLIRFGLTGESIALNKSLELPVKKKNGEKLTVELSVAKTKIDNRWHAIGIMRDITEKKKSEEAILERAKELERLNSLMVGRELKMIELKREIASLKEKSAAKK